MIKTYTAKEAFTLIKEKEPTLTMIYFSSIHSPLCISKEGYKGEYMGKVLGGQYNIKFPDWTLTYSGVSIRIVDYMDLSCSMYCTMQASQCRERFKEKKIFQYYVRMKEWHKESKRFPRSGSLTVSEVFEKRNKWKKFFKIPTHKWHGLTNKPSKKKIDHYRKQYIDCLSRYFSQLYAAEQ